MIFEVATLYNQYPWHLGKREGKGGRVWGYKGGTEGKREMGVGGLLVFVYVFMNVYMYMCINMCM